MSSLPLRVSTAPSPLAIHLDLTALRSESTALHLPDECRVDLLDLRALEHDLAPVRRAELLLQRVAFEVDSREVWVGRGRKRGDGVELVVVGLRGKSCMSTTAQRREVEHLLTQNSSSSVNGASSSADASTILLFPTSSVVSLVCGGPRISKGHKAVTKHATHQLPQALDLRQAVVREV